MIDGGLRGRIQLARACGQSELLQVREIIGGAFRGIVGEKRIADAEAPQLGQKWLRTREQSAALVDGAVHVERDMGDASQPGTKLSLLGRRARGARDE